MWRCAQKGSLCCIISWRWEFDKWSQSWMSSHVWSGNPNFYYKFHGTLRSWEMSQIHYIILFILLVKVVLHFFVELVVNVKLYHQQGYVQGFLVCARGWSTKTTFNDVHLLSKYWNWYSKLTLTHRIINYNTYHVLLALLNF